MPKDYRSLSEAASVLGTLFYADPASEQCAPTLAWIAEPENQTAWGFGGQEAQEALADLAKAAADEGVQQLHRDYNRVFVGPNKLPAPPWGSVYTDPESVIFGNQTLALRRWMRDNLVQVNLVEKEPEDHFGIMLLMVSWAVTHSVTEEGIDAFFEEHLLPWSGRFLELFVANVDSAFYEAAGRLAQATLADWETRFELEPLTVPLAR
jgi:TorA maturation chaperone TorD